jgi:glycosyltransferase EpsD
MRWFRQQGWQVDYVSDGERQIPDCDNQYAISIKRNPYNFKNITAYKQLKKILLNNYYIVHCHTPMGGVLGRLAAKNIKTKAKIIYTAHGFHFYKGASLFNWLVYYPIEKYLAKYTDIFITINEEDYLIAKKNFSICKNISKIDGVGVDLTKFSPRFENDKKQLRSELGYKNDDYILTNVAEITKNKNQIMLIKVLPKLIKIIPNLRVLFIGNYNYSTIKQKLELLIKKLQVQDFVHFLGYRNDVDKLTSISNIAFSASLREGLPVNIIEAMACGIPIVCRRNRGHNSLIVDGKSGLLFSNTTEMIENILKIYNSKSFTDVLSQNAIESSKKYSQEIIIKKMSEIYERSIQE